MPITQWHTSIYEWHADDARGHMDDTRVTYRCHVVRKKNKGYFFKAFYKFSFKMSDLYKNSLHAMAVLGYWPELKRGLVLALGAHFLFIIFWCTLFLAFSYKRSLFNTLSIDIVSMPSFFTSQISKKMLLILI